MTTIKVRNAAKELVNSHGWKSVVQPAIEETIRIMEAHLFTVSKNFNEKIYTKHDLFRMVRTSLIKINNAPLEILAMPDATKINSELEEQVNELVERYQS